MEKYNTDDTFLARWIAGELSDEERITFEKTDAYKQFRIINNEAQNIEALHIDVEAALETTKQKIQSKKRKPKVITLWSAIAASVVILLGFSAFLTSSKSYTTGIGENKTITLADGSIVELNANSSIKHKRFGWENNKVLTLTGEAYFTVTKGQKFSVNTSKGIVSVLGTQFNIKDRNEIYTVTCYEGKVKHSYQKMSNLLTQGKRVTVKNNTITPSKVLETTPDWKTGYTKFTNAKLSQVLKAIEIQFPITFKVTNTSINMEQRFSGKFTHKSLNTALLTTLVPMQISYEQQKNTIVIK